MIRLNRYLAGNRLRPRYVWENVKSHLEQTPDGYLLFDDTVLEKRYAKEIAIAQRQYSGNAGGIINGIGIVTCVYVNPELDRFWVIDYRIYDPRGDGKTKLDRTYAASIFSVGDLSCSRRYSESIPCLT